MEGHQKCWCCCSHSHKPREYGEHCTLCCGHWNPVSREWSQGPVFTAGVNQGILLCEPTRPAAAAAEDAARVRGDSYRRKNDQSSK